MSSKIFICSPYGGINDSLVQISLSYDYCVKYQSMIDKLYIYDENSAGMFGMFGDVFDLSKFSFPVVSMIRNHVVDKELFDKLDLFPKYCHLDRNRYSFGLKKFNFLEQPIDPVLIHASDGGGLPSKAFLQNLCLSPSIAKLVAAELSHLPEKYFAIHVRNSDVISINWKKYLADFSKRNPGCNVLVCSDDIEVLNSCEKLMPNVNLIKFSNSIRAVGVNCKPGSKERRLHNRAIPTEMKVPSLVRAFRDLLALSFSDQIFSPSSQTASGAPFVSGFMRLARLLSEDNHKAARSLLLIS